MTLPGQRGERVSPRSGPDRYFSMYTVRGGTTPWRSMAAASSGGGEAIIFCIPAMSWMSAVMAINLPPYLGGGPALSKGASILAEGLGCNGQRAPALR